LTIQTTDGRTLRIPEELPHPFNVVLVNRGSWCPYCNQQLRAFESGRERLAAEGIGIVSLSVDPLEKAAAVAAEHHLGFPVGWGADVHEVAEKLGLFYDAHPGFTAPYLQSSGFVLGPGHRILNAVYSTGPIGRLVWQDVLGFVQYVKSHA
jgi:peroxiredoxin